MLALLLAVTGIASVYLQSGTTAVINWTDMRQSIDGFGASSADFVTSLSPAQADFFFTTRGIGLSILRTQIVPNMATCNAEFRNGGCGDSNGQILNGELRERPVSGRSRCDRLQHALESSGRLQEQRLVQEWGCAPALSL